MVVSKVWNFIHITLIKPMPRVSWTFNVLQLRKLRQLGVLGIVASIRD